MPVDPLARDTLLLWHQLHRLVSVPGPASAKTFPPPPPLPPGHAQQCGCTRVQWHGGSSSVVPLGWSGPQLPAPPTSHLPRGDKKGS